MAIIIDSTPGGATANSYCSKSEADQYHDGRLNSDDWYAADDDSKNRALVTATRLLDEHIEWVGYLSTNTQALQWPRVYMPTDRRLLLYPPGAQPFDWWNANYIDPTIIPDRLKQATAEFARQLLVADRTEDDDLSRKQITEIQAGSVKLSFKGYAQPQVIPDSVYYFVRLWGRIRHRSNTSTPLRRS
jgi:hypothetical protein